jgi:hypothetical protein
LREGVRAGLPFAAAALVLGISFGVLARPVMGEVAPIVMSAAVFAGSSQFAAWRFWPPAERRWRRSRPGPLISLIPAYLAYRLTQGVAAARGGGAAAVKAEATTVP